MSKPKEQLLKKHRKNNLDLIKNTITLIIFYINFMLFIFMHFHYEQKYNCKIYKIILI